MSEPFDKTGKAQLRLFRTLEHPCPYLPGREARNLVVDPNAVKSDLLYGLLAEHGFRRNGSDIYRPDCEACRDCVPIRVPVQRFEPRRSQRRIWHKQRQDIQVIPRPAVFDDEHYQLFSRYLQQRHPDGDMASSTPEDYRHFLLGSWCDTRLIEFRRQEKLLAVAVTDFLPKGLSAVYTFFDPALSRESPGVFSILWQIEEARRRGLLWLYLGFWIPGCRKMVYKEEYRPLQLLWRNQWQEFPPKLAIHLD